MGLVALGREQSAFVADHEAQRADLGADEFPEALQDWRAATRWCPRTPQDLRTVGDDISHRNGGLRYVNIRPRSVTNLQAEYR